LTIKIEITETNATALFPVPFGQDYCWWKDGVNGFNGDTIRVTVYGVSGRRFPTEKSRAAAIAAVQQEVERLKLGWGI
jgi:hypothetical protein